MLKNNVKLTGKVLLIMVTLILISAFTIKQEQSQEATDAPSPTITATLPEGEPRSASDSDESALASTLTPTPGSSDALEAYSAYTPTPLPEIKSYKETASFTFKNIGEETIVLHFPDAEEMYLALPNQWDIAYPFSYLELHYDYFEEADWEDDSPLVEVYVNEYLAGVFAPESGKNKIARITLPSLLVDERPFNTLNDYSIRIQHFIGEGDAFDEDFCDYEGILTIKDDSSINVTFDEIGARRNLADFPRPLVQDTFLPETLHFILPNDYTEGDLAALITAASAVGRGTFGNLKFNVVTASQITSNMLQGSNAIVIGKPDSNAFLEDLYADGLMPTELSSDGASILGLSGQDDGILQLIASNQDTKNSFLIVSGNTDQGFLKAAQALSDPPVGMSGTMFVVRADLELTPEDTQEEVFSKRFSELGFTDRVIYGIGREQNYLTFFVPRDWNIHDDSMITLNYAHSGDISYPHSALNVYLNGVPIADAVIDERVGEKQIEIPLENENILIGSQNILQFETVIQQYLDCAPYDPRSSWVVIRDSSILHLPHSKITDPEGLPPVVHPLYHLVTVPKILFSLPQEPSSDELNSIAQLSYTLGRRLLDNQTGIDFSVNLDPDFDPSTLENTSMILVGKPTTNALIAEINDALPQPFVSGEDALTPKQLAGQYRIQEDVSIGLIQAFPSTWDPFSSVTVITGTTDEGLKWALDAVIDEDIYWAMSGDIVFVRENVVKAFQSSAPIRASVDVVVSEMTEEEVDLEEIEPTTVLTPEATPDQYVRPVTSQQKAPVGLYAIYGLVFVGVVVAVIGLIRAMRGGRKR